MKGAYEQIIEGYSYVCPECSYANRFSFSDDGCGECGFREEYVDPDEWFDGNTKLIKKIKNRDKLKLYITEIITSNSVDMGGSYSVTDIDTLVIEIMEILQ